MPAYSIYTTPIRFGTSGCYRFSVLHTIDSFDAFVDLHDESSDAANNYFSFVLPRSIWEMYKAGNGQPDIKPGSYVRVTKGEHNDPDTEECGGVVDRITSDRAEDTVLVEGRTWRGLTVGRQMPWMDDMFPQTFTTANFLSIFCKLAGVIFTPLPGQANYGNFVVYNANTLYTAFETAVEDRNYFLTFQPVMTNNVLRVNVGIAPFVDKGCVRTGNVTSVFGSAGVVNHITYAVVAPSVNMAQPPHTLDVASHHASKDKSDGWSAGAIQGSWISGTAVVSGTTLCFPAHEYNWGVQETGALKYQVPKTCWTRSGSSWVQVTPCVTGVEYFDVYMLSNGTVSVVPPSNYSWMSSATAPSWAGTPDDYQITRPYKYNCEQLGKKYINWNASSALAAGAGSVNLTPLLQQDALAVFLGTSDTDTRTGDVSYEVPIGSRITLDDSTTEDYYVVGRSYQLQDGIMRVESAIANEKYHNVGSTGGGGTGSTGGTGDTSQTGGTGGTVPNPPTEKSFTYSGSPTSSGSSMSSSSAQVPLQGTLTGATSIVSVTVTSTFARTQYAGGTYTMSLGFSGSSYVQVETAGTFSNSTAQYTYSKTYTGLTTALLNQFLNQGTKTLYVLYQTSNSGMFTVQATPNWTVTVVYV
jgi:hypothetical protein